MTQSGFGDRQAHRLPHGDLVSQSIERSACQLDGQVVGRVALHQCGRRKQQLSPAVDAPRDVEASGIVFGAADGQAFVGPLGTALPGNVVHPRRVSSIDRIVSQPLAPRHKESHHAHRQNIRQPAELGENDRAEDSTRLYPLASPAAEFGNGRRLTTPPFGLANHRVPKNESNPVACRRQRDKSGAPTVRSIWWTAFGGRARRDEASPPSSLAVVSSQSRFSAADFCQRLLVRHSVTSYTAGQFLFFRLLKRPATPSRSTHDKPGDPANTARGLAGPPRQSTRYLRSGRSSAAG